MITYYFTISAIFVLGLSIAVLYIKNISIRQSLNNLNKPLRYSVITGGIHLVAASFLSFIVMIGNLLAMLEYGKLSGGSDMGYIPLHIIDGPIMGLFNGVISLAATTPIKLLCTALFFIISGSLFYSFVGLIIGFISKRFIGK